MKSRNVRNGRAAREQRQQDAQRRQQAHDARTPFEQIEVLNARLGAGQGATRETNRLLARAGGRTPEQQTPLGGQS